MCGSATLTIEVSSTSSVAPSITASATSHLCDSTRCACSRSGEVNFGAVAIYEQDRSCYASLTPLGALEGAHRGVALTSLRGVAASGASDSAGGTLSEPLAQSTIDRRR